VDGRSDEAAIRVPTDYVSCCSANSLGLVEAMASATPFEVSSQLKKWETDQLKYGQYLQELGQTLGNRSQFGDPQQVLDLSKLAKPGETKQ
jgi:hypothetical protein